MQLTKKELLKRHPLTKRYFMINTSFKNLKIAVSIGLNFFNNSSRGHGSKAESRIQHFFFNLTDFLTIIELLLNISRAATQMLVYYVYENVLLY